MQHADQDGPFDRTLRRLRRDRAARAGPDGAWLQAHMAEELAERLAMVTRPFGRALDLGCGAGALGQHLRGRGIEAVEADAGAVFARAVQCDEDRLPFADGSFDLVVSAGALDSVNDLPGALTLIRRALRPDGLFLAAFVGAGSLTALRGAMHAADEAEGGGASARIHPQIDVRAAGDLLGRAGFALPVADCDRLNVRYGALSGLVRDLRAMAATNMLAARSRRPITRIGYAAASADFAARSDADGKTSERFEIVYLSGWSPGPDQPRPARRGSATASLANALRPKDGL